MNFYRQHPNDGEGNVFTGVCLLIDGRGGLVAGRARGGGVVQSLVLPPGLATLRAGRPLAFMLLVTRALIFYHRITKSRIL